MTWLFLALLLGVGGLRLLTAYADGANRLARDAAIAGKVLAQPESRIYSKGASARSNGNAASAWGNAAVAGQPTSTLAFLPFVANNFWDVDVSQLVETDDDILGISDLQPGPYQEVIAAGARVVNLEPMNTFFVLWVPKGYETMATRRVIVIAHGHGGTAYREVGLEMDFAQKYGYAIVAIQWWTGVDEVMYSGQQFYQFMDIALRYMQYKYHTQLDNCALRGWSFGSEISYEVTYLDRVSGHSRLALTISHDGFMRPNPADMSVGQEFTQNLYDGVYGTDAFSGTHFYLYAGDVHSDITNTVQVITTYGGVVERAIIDAGAGHDGFYRHPQYHEEALSIFFSLAP
jgi:hypothetical protein